jgi:hypothetical protein
MATNQPTTEQRLERLEREVTALRVALSQIMAGQLTAFQALEHIEAAAREMREIELIHEEV